MKYRAEIDGLRALAVVPVILFHAGFELFSGGFVGVDVFFVISGYLITTILIEDIENKRFSIVNFYERRARRILPILLTVLFTSIVLAIFVLKLHPIELVPFSKSVLSQLFFVSNEYFWRTTGYFGATSSDTLLLHLWTLSVEEQFYIGLPVAIFLVTRYANSHRRIIFTSMTLTSFIACVLLVERYANPAFFSIATRAWELGIGVALALFLSGQQGNNKNEYLSILGLFGIAISYIIIDTDSVHPGYVTLIPTISTAILLYFSSGTLLAHHILGNKLLRYIGKISFSLYLWHHIVFVSTKDLLNISHFNPYSLVSYSAILLTFILSVISYHYIELPFRYSKKISSRLFAASSIFVIGLILIFSIGSISTNGFTQQIANMRFGSLGQEGVDLYVDINEASQWKQFESLNENCIIHAGRADEINLEKVEFCNQRYGPAILIVGDSHALNLNKILAKSGDYPFILGLNNGGCRPHSENQSCVQRYEEYKQWIKINERFISFVLFHQSGSHLIADSAGKTDSSNAFMDEIGNYSFRGDYIRHTLRHLELIAQETSLRVIWLGPFIEYRLEALDLFPDPTILHVNRNSPKIFGELNSLLKNYSQNYSGVQYINWSDVLHQPVNAYDGSCFYFLDRDHYSACGEDVIADKFSFDFEAWISAVGD